MVEFSYFLISLVVRIPTEHLFHIFFFLYERKQQSLLEFSQLYPDVSMVRRPSFSRVMSVLKSDVTTLCATLRDVGSFFSFLDLVVNQYRLYPVRWRLVYSLDERLICDYN